jgi:ribonuclease VapC
MNALRERLERHSGRKRLLHLHDELRAIRERCGENCPCWTIARPTRSSVMTSADCRMVIDTSAVLAILLDELDAPGFELAIEADPNRLISAASVLEIAIVLGALRRCRLTGIQFIPTQGQGANDCGYRTAGRSRPLAYRTYGEARHPGELNFGDCFSYALSKTSAEPLLFKGDDFLRTDVEWVALPRV